ncbi:uncharacterized protein DUF2249 [Fontibacillus phaseoli]|uniref:Uncharacterized protein DUF2249 n=1 Tax=Fontibacillus phaseoli TaxID=1416533 RepID=A0A369B938_9BACL|nr:DUF2249 domain-containing protein [Fontibacillus phaseoli]RCX17056.1 uncharacterized protein DUF2249 [Fontibacillus phaseoli]
MNRNEAKIVELDVRDQLRKKLEPFQLIMDTVKTLEADDIFVLHATFKPTPLLGFLKMRGYAGKSQQKDKEHWITTFVSKKNKHWLDEQPTAGKEDAMPASTSSDQTLSAEADHQPKVIELDNRGLEPPQPMMRTLAALDRSRPGDRVLIHNDRVPVFLIEELNGMGCPFTVEEQPDGSAKVTITKA